MYLWNIILYICILSYTNKILNIYIYIYARTCASLSLSLCLFLVFSHTVKTKKSRVKKNLNNDVTYTILRCDYMCHIIYMIFNMIWYKNRMPFVYIFEVPLRISSASDASCNNSSCVAFNFPLAKSVISIPSTTLYSPFAHVNGKENTISLAIP